MSHKAFHQREIEHLQEQNRRIVLEIEAVEVERDKALESLQACEAKDDALQAQILVGNDQISALSQRLAQDKAECVAKDEHVKVLGEQNNQMLGLLEQEENQAKDFNSKIAAFEAKNRKLQKIAELFESTKAELEKQIAIAKGKCAQIAAEVRSVRGVNENLRANIQNTEAKTRVDIEALGQAMQVLDAKNLEYLNRMNKQESREKQLQAQTNSLKEEVENVRAEIDMLRKKLEGDHDGLADFERSRSQIELSIEAMEIQSDTLKKALSTAERSNEQMQEENRTAADRCRETADKVYALMDSLRLNQVELKKIEAENSAKDKKVASLERQTQNLQAKISMECDAKVLAEQERREAEQEAIVLKKKNKVIEEAVATAQVCQEKAEKAMAEVNETVASMQTQNAYLASRIDGQEEEKKTHKAEIAKTTKKTADFVRDNARLRDEIVRIEEDVATAQHDLRSYSLELAHIKREDVMDDAGRQRPILIQSNDSDLLEKLQINEFLYEAQQARNPVPPMIEKIAQLLAMLHEGQGRADQYLGDLSKANGLVMGLRQRNMALFSRTQMFESFKTRALVRYVMNLIEGELCTNMHIDGLSFGQREINEMLMLIPRYECQDKIQTISLIDNALDDDAINLLMSLVHTLPYLRRLDLKNNCLSAAGLKKIEDQLRQMEGITGVIRTADGILNVHSGNQLRLSVVVGEQLAKDQIAREIDFSVNRELEHKDADPFLSANSGATGHPWTKTIASRSLKPAGQAVPDASYSQLNAPLSADADGGEPGRGARSGRAGRDEGQPKNKSGAGDEDSYHPSLAGPPVGLGGPGNVAALTKRKTSVSGKEGGKLPAKKQSSRAKAGPPAALEMDLSRYDWDPPKQRSLDRSLSVPALPPAGGTRGSYGAALAAYPSGAGRRPPRY